ncbi:MAG: alginate export family protein [Candidatus Eisenbacteria sp.]|nr:alginate export family protein [Candidatus Eisenbacteria bacterium]
MPFPGKRTHWPHPPLRIGFHRHVAVSAAPGTTLLFCALIALAFPSWVLGQRDVVPAVGLDVGFDTRVREVTLHNLLDFNDDSGPAVSGLLKASDTHFFRVRHRVSASLKFRAGFDLYSRFTTEWRKYLDPYESPTKMEIILDHLYLDVPEFFHLPLSLRVGRQDIIRGEGFMLLDGGPRDGSRSIYQNAIVLGIQGAAFGLKDATIDLFAIRNLAHDPFIVANDLSEDGINNRIVEKDETAFGVYVTNPEFGQQNEIYYFYKEEEPDSDPYPDTRLHTRLHTIGMRLSGDLPWALKYAAEAAWQTGSQTEWQPDSLTEEKISDHNSYGIYAWVSRSFIAPLQPTLKIGGIHLSGDDAHTEECEDWNPLFSRWPKWSELYIYTLIPEYGRVAYWSNLTSLNAQVALRLTKRAKFSYTFHKLGAVHPATPALLDDFYGEGTDRGELHEWKLSAEFGTRASCHFLIERFVAGDFYENPLGDDGEPIGKDDAYFFRWELMVKW